MNIFKNRNFLLMFSGRIISNIGDSLYAVAAMLLVYQLGGSTFYTGLAGFLSIIPRVIEFFSGPLLDKMNIRSMLISTQLIQAVLLLVIPAAHFFGFLTITLVLIITPLLSTINIIIFPAQLAALPTILPPDDLTKGNSLFSFAYQGVDIVFNSVSAILFIAIGPFALYMTNSALFFIGALLFVQIKLPKKEKNIDASAKNFPLCYIHTLKI